MAVNAVGQAADANGTVVFHREKIKFHYAQKTGIHSLFDQDNFLIKRDFLSYLDLVRRDVAERMRPNDWVASFK
jgi:hypothetical protein